MSPKSTVCLIGVTGGTGLSLLRFCLTASYQCTVIVRNPDKLLFLLSLSEAPSNLTIITGSIRDTSTVQRALLTSDGKFVDIVVSCIGYVTNITSPAEILKPSKYVDDRKICEDGTEIIVSAILDLKQKFAASDVEASSSSAPKDTDGRQGPVLVVLSSTGLTRARRDIPLLMIPLYHALLGAPHKDKRAMEDFLHSSAVPPSQPWIVIRPSLLTGDGKADPTGKKIRVGTEKDGKHEKLVVGYSIQRQDVGHWIFKEIIKGEWERWAGKEVTLTY